MLASSPLPHLFTSYPKTHLFNHSTHNLTSRCIAQPYKQHDHADHRLILSYLNTVSGHYHSELAPQIQQRMQQFVTNTARPITVIDKSHRTSTIFSFLLFQVINNYLDLYLKSPNRVVNMKSTNNHERFAHRTDTRWSVHCPHSFSHK